MDDSDEYTDLVFRDDEISDSDSQSGRSDSPCSDEEASRRPNKKGKFVCNLCTRSYKNIERFRQHLGKHALKDLLEHNSPGISSHRQYCRKVYKDVLHEFEVLKPGSSMTTEVQQSAQRLLSSPPHAVTIFIDLLADQFWECLPGPAMLSVDQVHCTFRRNINTMIANSENRETLSNVLRSDLLGLTCSDKSLNWFLCHFSRKLSLKSEVFFVCCLREPYEGPCKELERDNTDDINFQQSVHYVGGSTVKGVLRKAQKGLGTKSWSDIYDCMMNKFVVREGLESTGEEIEAWTNAMDRGGLQHINAKVWSFLIALSCILNKEEGDDGSILHSRVFKVVVSDDVMMFLWHDITQNCLTEEVDTLLLQNFCEFFTNTWLRGVILRRKKRYSPSFSRQSGPSCTCYSLV